MNQIGLHPSIPIVNPLELQILTSALRLYLSEGDVYDPDSGTWDKVIHKKEAARGLLQRARHIQFLTMPVVDETPPVTPPATTEPKETNVDVQ